MSKTVKHHYPILNPNAAWGLRPLCRHELPGAMYSLTVSQTTCELCLMAIARAQTRVETMRKAVLGEKK